MYNLIQADSKLVKSALGILILGKKCSFFVLAPKLVAYEPGTIGDYCDHHNGQTFAKRKLPQSYLEPRDGTKPHSTRARSNPGDVT